MNSFLQRYKKNYHQRRDAIANALVAKRSIASAFKMGNSVESTVNAMGVKIVPKITV